MRVRTWMKSEITCFLESGSEAVADRVLDSIAVRFDMLADWPRADRRREDLRSGYRSHAAGKYIIFYRVAANDDVIIQRVLHGRRDLLRGR
jgi:toxin ParE1/3/4